MDGSIGGMEQMSFSRALPRNLAALLLTLALALTVLVVAGSSSPASAATCTDRQLPVSSAAAYLGVDRRHSAQFRGQVSGGVTYVNFWFDGTYRGLFNPNGVLVTGSAPISVLYRTVTTTEIWLGKVRQVLKNVVYLRVCGTYWVKLA